MSSGPRAADAESTTEQLRPSPSRLPLSFIENRGQVVPQVDYYLRGAEASAFFTSGGLTLSLQKGDWALRLAPVGAEATEPAGAAETPATVSYFRGAPEEWVAGLQTYSRVAYRELWPGIDLVYSGDATRLKYRFVVQPGADPSDIRLAWEGATGLSLNERGQLEVSAGRRTLVDQAPISYQDAAGGRVAVPTSYSVSSGSRFGFRVGAYDPARPLVIDPAVLLYAGYIGGIEDDSAADVAVDPAGNAYVVGSTDSDQTTFPEVVGPDLSFDDAVGVEDDAFVAKVNADGTGLVYAGYIGGSDDEDGESIAVDAAGNAYVGGDTDSSPAEGFPVAVGPDLTYGEAVEAGDSFVAKVNPTGTALVYSGYIGGEDEEDNDGIAVDGAGNAYLSGEVESSETEGFPVTVGPDLTYNGPLDDAYVAKVKADGTGFVYLGYIGGTGDDDGEGIAVDGAGNAYVTGETDTSDGSFPDGDGFGALPGADTTHNGLDDAWLAKVKADGTGLAYATYIGGSEADFGNDVAIDVFGNAYVGGDTESGEATFPVLVGPDLTFNSTPGVADDAFVTKVDAAGTALVYSGYIGGPAQDFAIEIAVDGPGNAYLTGSTESTEPSFPVTIGPDLTQNGLFDAFVTKVNAVGSGLVYSGFIGGSLHDFGDGIALDPGANAYVVGDTESTETTFPVTVGPDLTFNDDGDGDGDAFVAKVETTETCQGKLVTHLGSNLNDALTGTSKADVVKALGGKDTIRAKNGKDRICAGNGNDTAKGGGGADRLKGEGGRDTLVGGGGKDRCVGGPGKDTGKTCEKGKV